MLDRPAKMPRMVDDGSTAGSPLGLQQKEDEGSDAKEYFYVVVPEEEDGAAYDNDIGGGDEGPGMFGECDFCVDNEVCKVCGNKDGCPPGFEYAAGQLCGICGARGEHMTGGCPHMEARLEKCREGLEEWNKWMLSRGRE